MILTVGTSLEAEEGPGGWRYRLDQRMGGGRLVDRSLGGGAWTHPNADGQTIGSRLNAALAELSPDVVFLGGPVNDPVSLYDTSSLRWAVQHGIDACWAAGVRRVVVGGILPFTDGGAFSAGWWPRLEQMRVSFNEWAAYAGQVEPGVEYSGDLAAVLAAPGGTRGDARWFRDGLHPNRFGAVLAAEAFPIELLEV